jgi:hypothetical protein
MIKHIITIVTHTRVNGREMDRARSKKLETGCAKYGDELELNVWVLRNE